MANSVEAFEIRVGERSYVVSATQLARAVSRAAPGTSLTYDHLLTCSAARPGGPASLFARLRGRMVLGYDEVVGENQFGRYIGDPAVPGRWIGDPPVPEIARQANPYKAQYMILLDERGAGIGVSPFQGMRSSGLPAIPLEDQ